MLFRSQNSALAGTQGLTVLRSSRLALALSLALCSTFALAAPPSSDQIYQAQAPRIPGLNTLPNPEHSTNDNPLHRHQEWYNSMEAQASDRANLNRRYAQGENQLFESHVVPTRDLSIQRNHALNIPIPRHDVSYKSHSAIINQGNGYYVVPKSGDSGLAKDADPLASPYYDPVTGKITPPPGVIVDKNGMPLNVDKDGNIIKKEINWDEIDPEKAMEARLKEYDDQLAQEKRAEIRKNPFGDILEHDKVYDRIEKTKDAFYIDREADAQRILDAVALAENNISGEIGFVVLGSNGIIMLKDNRPFPLYGLSKFHLAYAVGNLMSSIGDNLERPLEFNVKSLNRNVTSPLAEMLLSTVGREAAIHSGVVVDPLSNTKGGSVGSSSAERAKAIAKAARASASGQAVERPRGELRRVAVAQNSLFEEDQTLDDLAKSGKTISLSIADLMNYSLGQSDSNASGILLNYLGTLPALELFDRTKGLRQATFKYSEAQSFVYPDLCYENTAPLYETAKLYATYWQDKTLNPDIKNMIDEIMFFNVASKDAIQKGVRSALERESPDDALTLKMYSRSGVAGVNKKGDRVVVSDMALIDYKDVQYLMLIAIRDIKGDFLSSQRRAESTIALLSKNIFDYLRTRPIDPNNKVALPAQIFNRKGIDIGIKQ